MRKRVKLGLAAPMAALLLAGVLSTASARSLSVTNQNIRVTWANLEFSNEGPTIRCQVTLEGSLHSRTITKIARTLVGMITRATIAEERCAGGPVTPRALPWHLTYESFVGLLPTPTAIRFLISRYLFRIVASELACTYGTATDNLTFTATINAAREFTEFMPFEGANVSHLLEGLFLCRSERAMASPAGDGLIHVLGTTAKITITLI